jgi:hypothetical protein
VAAFSPAAAGAIRCSCRRSGWSGEFEEFEAIFHEEFAPFMPDRAHRQQMFRVLKREGDPTETPLVNLRSAKQLADLYLIYTGRRTWRTILDRQASTV